MGSRSVERQLIENPQPWYRDLMGRSFNLAVRTLGLADLGDTQCGFKLFPGDLARMLSSAQKLDGFAFDVELLVLARHWGFPVHEVGVRWQHVEASRVQAVRHSSQMLRDVLRLWLWRASSRLAGLPRNRLVTKPPTAPWLVERFFEHLEWERNLSPATLKAYRRETLAFLDFAAAELDVRAPEQASAGIIRAYLAHLHSKKLASAVDRPRPGLPADLFSVPGCGGPVDVEPRRCRPPPEGGTDHARFCRPLRHRGATRGLPGHAGRSPRPGDC